MRWTERCRVGARPFAAIDLPTLLSRGLVQGQQVAPGLMVAEEEQQPVVEDRRAAVPPADVEGGVILPEVPLPEESTARGEGDELAGPKPGIHGLAIGHRAGAGEIVLAVERWGAARPRHAVLPQQPAVGAVKGLNHERHARSVLGVTGGSGPLELAPGSGDRSLSDL